MRAEAVLAESNVSLPRKSKARVWTSVAAGLTLCAGIAGWAVQGGAIQLFAPQAVKAVAVVPTIASVSVEAPAALPAANLQMSYALTTLPAAPSAALK